MKTQPNNTFKKSVLSIVIISAVTGAFISWDKYQPRHETTTMVEFYQNRGLDGNDLFTQSIASTDSEVLALIAEENLMQDIILEAHYSPEADEAYYETELALKVETIDEEKVRVDEAMVIENQLLFAFDSTQINPDYFSSLNKTALFMQQHSKESNKVWQVVGYADRSGNALYNSKLAKKRAQIVAEYLINKGVNEDQLAIISLGASAPLNTERSIENNRHERRVEIHDYQEEITALVEQLNKPVVSSHKIATAPLREQETAPIQVEKNEPTQVSAAIDFKNIKRERLTTAMEL